MLDYMLEGDLHYFILTLNLILNLVYTSTIILTPANIHTLTLSLPLSQSSRLPFNRIYTLDQFT